MDTEQCVNVSISIIIIVGEPDRSAICDSLPLRDELQHATTFVGGRKTAANSVVSTWECEQEMAVNVNPTSEKCNYMNDKLMFEHLEQFVFEEPISVETVTICSYCNWLCKSVYSC